MSYTKGKWTTKRNETPEITVLFRGIPDEEQEANARLIAAAPDLLEACEGLIEFAAKEMTAIISEDEEWLIELKNKIKTIKDAIAKAKGQENESQAKSF